MQPARVTEKERVSEGGGGGRERERANVGIGDPINSPFLRAALAVVIAAGNAFPDTGEIVLQIAAGKCALFRLPSSSCRSVALSIRSISRAIPYRRMISTTRNTRGPRNKLAT